MNERFEDLIDADELDESELERLRRVHELLLRVSPPPEVPVGAYTEFYWTVNARALMNFVSLRAAETAQREIRMYADACERFLAEQMPITHDAFVANNRTAP